MFIRMAVEGVLGIVVLQLIGFHVQRATSRGSDSASFALQICTSARQCFMPQAIRRYLSLAPDTCTYVCPVFVMSECTVKENGWRQSVTHFKNNLGQSPTA